MLTCKGSHPVLILILYVKETWLKYDSISGPARGTAMSHGDSGWPAHRQDVYTGQRLRTAAGRPYAALDGSTNLPRAHLKTNANKKKKEEDEEEEKEEEEEKKRKKKKKNNNNNNYNNNSSNNNNKNNNNSNSNNDKNMKLVACKLIVFVCVSRVGGRGWSVEVGWG